MSDDHASADHVLLDRLFERLVEDNASDRLVDTVLAAYAGETQLRAVLTGAPVELPDPRRPTPAPANVYLDSVAVCGFRGVGAKTVLSLRPYAGLTLIVGRNGSGKSSFAEAIELALTGDSQRWAEKHSVFRGGWRNLHVPTPCRVEVTARIDGEREQVRLRHSWRDDATEPDQGVGEIVAGGVRHADTGALGWRQPLDSYRPLLTANDLGRLISARPSDLFDALAPLLGIEPVTDADVRLKRLRKEYDTRVGQVKAERLELRRTLAEIDDDRARTAAKMLAAARPDLDALDALLASDGQATDPAVTACRRLVAAPPLPEQADVEHAAATLVETAERAAALTEAVAGGADRLSELLRLAIDHHDRHGEGVCPVCGVGRLDRQWRDTAVSQLGQADRDAAAVREAATARDAAAGLVRAILDTGAQIPAAAVSPGARVLDDAGALEAERDALAVALATWRAIDPAAAPATVAAHLVAAYPTLRAAFEQVRSAAEAWLQTRHDTWREHAAALQTWLSGARRARADEVPLSRLKEAIAWLKTATEELRADRLAPFAAQSQQIWERLRQESNVELAGMRLDGSSTRRRVAFPVTVDGTEAPAMAVMSQGELHALGLAVFLPRACADASPFRFLVIDDPVQSMDPSKVDGLAQVLADLAQRRQVVVFTHDNRLREAVRRLQIEATIWEVTRRENSEIEIRTNLDPVKRYLSDARALAKTTEFPDDVRGPVVLSLCRSAIEAACHERTRRVRIGRGERHADVEELLTSSLTTTQIAALALFDDPDAGSRVLPYLDRQGRWFADAFRACKEGAHGRYTGELDRLVADAGRLAERLR